VLNQTFQSFEIVIVDDGSTDDSLKAIQDVDDIRITIVCKENEGVSAARNAGVREAKYEWILFLDADDIWLPTHIETLVKLKDKYHGSLFFSSSFYINKVDSKISCKEKDYVIDDYFESFFQKSYLAHSSTVLIHREALNNVKGFNENLKCGEDI